MIRLKKLRYKKNHKKRIFKKLKKVPTQNNNQTSQYHRSTKKQEVFKLTTHKYQDKEAFRKSILVMISSKVNFNIMPVNFKIAAKVIKKSHLSPELQHLIHSEIQILRLINHENIVKCYEIVEDQKNIYIIQQLCNQGDLQSKVDKQGAIQQKQALSIIRGVFKGLCYLSQMNIIHRDLKVANVFMHEGKPKIADFGFAMCNKAKKQFQDISIGSPIYMSPQGIKHNVYGPKTDVWAFGIFLFELLHGKTPYSHCTKEKQLKYNITNPLNWNSLKANLSYQMKQIILKCLQVNYEKRITFEKLKQYEILKSQKITNKQSKNSSMLTEKKAEKEPSVLKNKQKAFLENTPYFNKLQFPDEDESYKLYKQNLEKQLVQSIQLRKYQNMRKQQNSQNFISQEKPVSTHLRIMKTLLTSLSKQKQTPRTRVSLQKYKPQQKLYKQQKSNNQYLKIIDDNYPNIDTNIRNYLNIDSRQKSRSKKQKQKHQLLLQIYKNNLQQQNLSKDKSSQHKYKYKYRDPKSNRLNTMPAQQQQFKFSFFNQNQHHNNSKSPSKVTTDRLMAEFSNRTDQMYSFGHDTFRSFNDEKMLAKKCQNSKDHHHNVHNNHNVVRTNDKRHTKAADAWNHQTKNNVSNKNTHWRTEKDIKYTKKIIENSTTISFTFPPQNINCYLYLLHFTRLIYKLSCHLQIKSTLSIREIRQNISRFCLDILYCLLKQLNAINKQTKANNININRTRNYANSYNNYSNNDNTTQSLPQITSTIEKYIYQYENQLQISDNKSDQFLIIITNQRLESQISRLFSQQLKSQHQKSSTSIIRLLYLSSIYLYHYNQIYLKYFTHLPNKQKKLTKISKYWYEYNLKDIIRDIEKDVESSNKINTMEQYLKVKKKIMERMG